MPVSKAQQKATNKYILKAYDRINLTVLKGRKDIIQAHAATQGESVNGFINRAIDSQMEQDASSGPVEAPQGAGDIPASPSTLKAAREAAEAAGEALPDFVERAVETQAKRDKLIRKMKGDNPNE